MEKYAVITTILDLEPIPDADRIERATVLGWQVVVMKGLHKIGDMVAMIFPDTLIPKKLLDVTYEGTEKIRLKTIKLKGQYSAGLIVPLSELPACPIPSIGYADGDEVSLLLGVEKYVAPISPQLAGVALGAFPTHLVSKTDEANYRSEVGAIAELANEEFANVQYVATMKCDGSSGTFIYTTDGADCVPRFRVCSRNLELKDVEGNTFWEVAKKYKLRDAMHDYGMPLAIQGEVCGPGIQGNPMKLTEHKLFVFLIRNVHTRVWFTWDETVDFCKKYDIPYVQEIQRWNTRASLPSFQELQKLANETKYANQTTNAEGIVLRTVTPVPSNALQKSWWSLKIMNEPYDTKKGS